MYKVKKLKKVLEENNENILILLEDTPVGHCIDNSSGVGICFEGNLSDVQTLLTTIIEQLNDEQKVIIMSHLNNNYKKYTTKGVKLLI